MKSIHAKTIASIAFLAGLFAVFVPIVHAQMLGYPSSTPSNEDIQSQQQDEQVGKKLVDQLNNRQITCQKLTDEDYEKIGEYYMGQSIGDVARHTQVDKHMQAMMGEQGEEQMHVVLGKRSSGCQPDATPSRSGTSFTPMMWMMGGGGNPMMGFSGWNNMMGGWGGFGIFGWLFMLIFWALIILGIIAIIRYLSTTGKKESRSPLDILKERYAKGEMSKEAFEEMKKDLS